MKKEAEMLAEIQELLKDVGKNLRPAHLKAIADYAGTIIHEPTRKIPAPHVIIAGDIFRSPEGTYCHPVEAYEDAINSKGKVRNCIRCRKRFISNDYGHRMCKKCRARQE